MIFLVAIAQLADLATYAVAVSLHPAGESGFAAGIPPSEIVFGKAVVVALVVGILLLWRERFGRLWPVAAGIPLVVGAIGAATNVANGILGG